MPDHSLKNAFPSPPPAQPEVDEFRHAAGRGDKAAVTAFLDKYPAAVDHASVFGDTALVYAAQTGRKEIVELLLARGAIADAPDSGGWTPFMWASLFGNKDTAELLWEKTASAAAKNYRGAMRAELEFKKHHMPSDTAIAGFVDGAAKGDVNAVTDFLDRHPPLINQVRGGNSALALAAFKGQKAVVELLLEKGAQLEMRDSSGRTPLLCAAGEGHTDIVELLWKKGADLNAKSNKNHTALMWAALSGRTETVRFFLERGFSLETVDERGQTALTLARMNRRTETTELIEQWPEILRQRQEQQYAKEYAENLARQEKELTDARLQKIKDLRTPKPPFKKNQP